MNLTDTNTIAAQWKEFYAAIVKKNVRLTQGYVDYVATLARDNVPPIFEINHLAQMVGVHTGSIANMQNNIQFHYRSFSIPKRSGGVRTISMPSPVLLTVQRWIANNILVTQALSENCHSFRKKRSIVTNASPHLQAAAILKLDLEDFFGSVKKEDVRNIFAGIGFPDNIVELLSTLCCHNDHLPQGAATSPMLSNIAAFVLDEALTKYAQDLQLIYTRYADDMTFSGKRIESSMLYRISNAI